MQQWESEPINLIREFYQNQQESECETSCTLLLRVQRSGTGWNTRSKISEDIYLNCQYIDNQVLGDCNCWYLNGYIRMVLNNQIRFWLTGLVTSCNNLQLGDLVQQYTHTKFVFQLPTTVTLVRSCQISKALNLPCFRRGGSSVLIFTIAVTIATKILKIPYQTCSKAVGTTQKTQRTSCDRTHCSSMSFLT
eukprot:TRINITY_DN7807_c0_g5_i2.p1 TRINITY_DN7807_c0_g5~~TRINITY_DN7807_c0_g5_i2.p1  ORF type:complete len:192 (-),score=-7.75 TRINITY_DN7807_c0_g5_i2:378-953(-)